VVVVVVVVVATVSAAWPQTHSCSCSRSVRPASSAECVCTPSRRCRRSPGLRSGDATPLTSLCCTPFRKPCYWTKTHVSSTRPRVHVSLQSCGCVPTFSNPLGLHPLPLPLRCGSWSAAHVAMTLVLLQGHDAHCHPPRAPVASLQLREQQQHERRVSEGVAAAAAIAAGHCRRLPTGGRHTGSAAADAGSVCDDTDALVVPMQLFHAADSAAAQLMSLWNPADSLEVSTLLRCMSADGE
jgi:hypothetical protein